MISAPLILSQQKPLRYIIQLIQLRLSHRKGKRSNTSAKGLLGMTSFIPETLPFIGFPLILKLNLAF